MKGSLDNLNTHGLASLYEAFDPTTARALAARLEIHCTPKQGSWLNMTETELSVLSRQCLDRRLESDALLTQEVTTWEQERNQACTKIDWRVTTADARVKLKRLYLAYGSAAEDYGYFPRFCQRHVLTTAEISGLLAGRIAVPVVLPHRLSVGHQGGVCPHSVRNWWALS